MYGGLVLGAHLPSGWLWPALILFGGVVFVALAVLLLVSGARFEDQQGGYSPTPSPGSCAPFCTEPVHAPVPQR
ncbi:hypothetical protein HLB23_08015 [Nocardia uniformis]|uniref:Uncharacterized protein n=2 Tax=Nocardia uniformis TaxID=53432 RepID=A0A849CA26_9NOCA|nr:hypothetical protein [Nocardia uniformis]